MAQTLKGALDNFNIIPTFVFQKHFWLMFFMFLQVVEPSALPKEAKSFPLLQTICQLIYNVDTYLENCSGHSHPLPSFMNIWLYHCLYNVHISIHVCDFKFIIQCCIYLNIYPRHGCVFRGNLQNLMCANHYNTSLYSMMSFRFGYEHFIAFLKEFSCWSQVCNQHCCMDDNNWGFNKYGTTYWIFRVCMDT